MYGFDGDDSLSSGSGDDYLDGGTGDDVLYGDDGQDLMFGGAGAYTFMFESASAFNDVDQIMDFSSRRRIESAGERRR